jgi:hypothetical protein
MLVVLILLLKDVWITGGRSERIPVDGWLARFTTLQDDICLVTLVVLLVS